MTTHPLDALRDELLAIDASELDVIDLDIESIAATALAALPRIRAHRSEVESSFAPAVAAERVARHDQLETRTLAMAEAHRRWDELDEVGTRQRADLIWTCRGLRTELLEEVRPLLASGHITPSEIRSLRRTNEPRDAALDLTLLAAVLHDHRARLLDLAECQRVAGALITALDVHGPQAVAMRAATDLRRRAFTSFVRLWDELRRDFTYVRWETEDEDTIVPPLWPGPGARKRPTARAIAELTRAPIDPFDGDPEA